MFTLIELQYAPDALEPFISERTLSFHHGKHLKGYVDNLNKLIPGSEFEALCQSGSASDPDFPGLSERSEESLEGSLLKQNEEAILVEIVKKSSGAIFNNAGQILNHNLYFTQFASASSLPAPTGNLLAQIEKQWGSFEAFQTDFVAKGVNLFGSGWVWLSAQEDGTLVISQEPGASNPVIRGLKPLLTFDVWEHSYYLDWQNRRADHLNALWQIVDWRIVEGRYRK